MSQMVSIKVGGLQALPAVQKSLTRRKLGDARLAPKFMTSATRGVRCESGGGRGPLADVQRTVDENTKHVITKDEILRNQEVNESEKQCQYLEPNPIPDPSTHARSWREGLKPAASRSGVYLHLMALHRRQSTADWYSILDQFSSTFFFLLPRVQISGI